jgi:hypothetical protein
VTSTSNRKFNVNFAKKILLTIRNLSITSVKSIRVAKENASFKFKLFLTDFSTGVDPKSSIIEQYMQMFEQDDTQMLDDTNMSCVAYFKCKKCVHLRFIKYYTYKEHILKVHDPLHHKHALPGPGNKTKILSKYNTT